MNDQNNELFAFIAIPIALLAIGAFLLKAAISFFNSLGGLMTSIATSFAGFAKLVFSIGLIAAAVAIVGRILYAAFYCIFRYIRTVRKVTAFREEFQKIDSLLRNYVDAETSKAKADVKKPSKEVNALIEELTRPKLVPEVSIKPEAAFAGPNPESTDPIQTPINSDPIKAEVMITNNF